MSDLFESMPVSNISRWEAEWRNVLDLLWPNWREVGTSPPLDDEGVVKAVAAGDAPGWISDRFETIRRFGGCAYIAPVADTTCKHWITNRGRLENRA